MSIPSENINPRSQPDARIAAPWLVVIAASAGGIQALQTVLAALPATLQGSVVIVQHRRSTPASLLDKVLARVAALPVTIANENEPLRPGLVYVARPDSHLHIDANHRFTYADGTRIRGVLSSANPLFESAAEVFGNRTIAVVLTGSGVDATDGVQTVKAHGGIVIVQDPASAQYSGMPSAAIGTGAASYVLPLESIAPVVVAITEGQGVRPESAM